MTTYLISHLGAKGDGIAPGPIYAPLTLPGEEISGELTGDRIAAPAIITPSPDRQDPPCPHFGACGGCALQHASDRFVANWKRDQIAARLAAAGVAIGDLRQTVTSPAQSRRRATFTARRTKKTVEIGFMARASDQIVAIETCAVIAPELLSAHAAIIDLTRTGASRKGLVKASVTTSEDGIDIAITGGKPVDHKLMIDLAAVAADHNLARLAWDGEIVVEARAPMQTMGAARVAPPPGGFLQATRTGEDTLVAAAKEALGRVRRIADLFAGCGAFALPLAETAEVHAVEAEAPLLAALTRGWRQAAGLKAITTEVRDLFRRPLIGEELTRLDGAIMDPPRAGAKAQADALAKDGPPLIAAISCDPATFARDAAILAAGGYQLDWVLPVDQFRWSPHIELASRFSR